MSAYRKTMMIIRVVKLIYKWHKTNEFRLQLEKENNRGTKND